MQQKGYVLLVGAEINYLSLIHQIEEDLLVPYRFYKEFCINVKNGKKINKVNIPYYARYLDMEVKYDYKKRENILMQSKAIITSRIGWGSVKFGRSDKIYDVLYKKMLEDRFFLLNK